MNRLKKLVPCLMLLTLAASASDTAVLRNGFSIIHQRRETLGDTTRLYINNNDPTSFVDVPTAEIDHFENVPDPPVTKTADTITANPTLKSAALPVQPFDLNETVKTASGTYQLDPDLVTSVIRAESAFNVRAVSPKGAQGLMQLMPQTSTQLGVKNAFDPQANVDAGTRYLRELLERYNFDLVKALAAYNAGPLRVEQYNGVPPYYETRAYVARIVRDFNKKKLAAKSAAAKSQPKAPTVKPAHAKSSVKLASNQPPEKN
jgi:soluble lytic murein transglycosylase-like protein